MKRLHLVTVCSVFGLASLVLLGCKTYYENAGMRLRAGNVKAPLEMSEPTSSCNVRFLFFLDGVDVYASKGSTVNVRYYAADGGNWLTSATTQAVEVAVLPCPTNAIGRVAK